MTEMPMFDDPVPTAPVEQPPRKPRKPMKRRRKAAKKSETRAGSIRLTAQKKRRKRRTLKTVVEKPNGHASGRYSKEVYDTIGRLMGMKGSDRETVLDIVKGLCA